MGYTLTITEGKDVGQSFEFDQPEVTIGRTADNDVVLSDAGVSRAHVRIRLDAGNLSVEDLGSSNGTYVNKRKITGETPVSDGDEVKVGGVLFLVAMANENATRIVAVAERPAFPPTRASPGKAPPAALPPRGAPAAPITRRTPSKVGPPPVDVEDPGGALARAPAGGGGAVERAGSVASRRKRRHEPTTPVEKLKAKLAELSPQQKAMAGGAFALFSLMAIGGIAVAVTSQANVSINPFGGGSGPYPLLEKRNKDIYGIGPDVTINSNDKVIFEWKFVEAEAGMTLVTVVYGAAYVQREDLVEIRLNDYPIGYAQQSLGDWQPGIELQLPRKYLRPNEVNTIVFDNTQNPPGEEMWEIGEVRVKVDPLPKCEPVECIAEAKKLYDVGKRDYDNKSIAAENLFNAWVSFRKARLYLEPVDPKPDLYDIVMQLLKDSSKELEVTCSRMRFTGIKSFSSGDVPAAQRDFQSALMYFPGPEHRCHHILKNHLEMVSD